MYLQIALICFDIYIYTYTYTYIIPSMYTYSDCLFGISIISHRIQMSTPAPLSSVSVAFSWVTLECQWPRNIQPPKPWDLLELLPTLPASFNSCKSISFPRFIYWKLYIKHKYQLSFMLCCTQIPAPHTYFLCFRSFLQLHMVRFGQVSRSVRSGTGDLGDVITSQSPQKKRLPPAMAGHVRTVGLLWNEGTSAVCAPC